MKWNRLLFLLSLILIFSLQILADSQVSFTKPGSMMRIPSSSSGESEYIFRAGFGTDFYSFDSKNTGLKPTSAVFLDSEISNSFSFGFSAVQPGIDSNSVEFGINLGKTVMSYGDISIAVGLWDFVISKVDGITRLKEDYSFYAVISSEKSIGDFALNSYMGIGSGTLSSKAATNDSLSSAGVFAGFLMRTDILKNNGGVDLIGEYDGHGINMGVRIPLTSDYRLNLGINQLQYLGNFGSLTSTDLPSISIGLSLAIPRIPNKSVNQYRQAAKYPVEKKYTPVNTKSNANNSNNIYRDELNYRSVLDSIITEADKTISILRDSLMVSRAEVGNLNNRVIFLRQQKSVLEDSLQSVKLQKHVMEQNINLALKHLSRSLRYFYAGNFEEALNEADMAIQLNPNLSLAYARRGSIYYKMGDLDRAMINWNLALRIDPEYDDVRNILKIISENRLRTTSFMGK
ncbi:MAG: hypothetical protein KAI81_04135 [Candidatus Marinimicrobia bacterium]|nr:hypothetical protein [Candidatus Neomarinimicrobiota bacterium]